MFKGRLFGQRVRRKVGHVGQVVAHFATRVQGQRQLPVLLEALVTARFFSSFLYPRTR
jgi:hypothetical protein